MCDANMLVPSAYPTTRPCPLPLFEPPALCGSDQSISNSREAQLMGIEQRDAENGGHPGEIPPLPMQPEPGKSERPIPDVVNAGRHDPRHSSHTVTAAAKAAQIPAQMPTAR
jgi:hypothetical protein